MDAIRVPDDPLYRSGTKIVWELVIVFLHRLGAIIYLAAGCPLGGASGAIAAWQARPAPGGGSPGAIPPSASRTPWLIASRRHRAAADTPTPAGPMLG